jgi:hypothetical protein
MLAAISGRSRNEFPHSANISANFALREHNSDLHHDLATTDE